MCVQVDDARIRSRKKDEEGEHDLPDASGDKKCERVKKLEGRTPFMASSAGQFIVH
jgi:hypothetical protein